MKQLEGHLWCFFSVDLRFLQVNFEGHIITYLAQRYEWTGAEEFAVPYSLNLNLAEGGYMIGPFIRCTSSPLLHLVCYLRNRIKLDSFNGLTLARNKSVRRIWALLKAAELFYLLLHNCFSWVWPEFSIDWGLGFGGLMLFLVSKVTNFAWAGTLQFFWCPKCRRLSGIVYFYKCPLVLEGVLALVWSFSSFLCGARAEILSVEVRLLSYYLRIFLD